MARRSSAATHEAGYSLMEMLVAMVILAELTIGVLLLFDYSNRYSRAQVHLSEIQRSLRASQLELSRSVRMAGRGGLLQNTPAMTRPDLGAVVNAVAADNATRIIAPNIASGNSPLAVLGTDILTLRGSFNNPIYIADENRTGAEFFTMRDAANQRTMDSSQAVTGTLQLCNTTSIGWTQTFDALAASDTAQIPEALLLQSTLRPEIYAVVAMDPQGTQPGAPACGAVGGFTIAFSVSGGTNNIADFYRQLSPVTTLTGMPANITNIARVAILEEYRYFVREAFAIPNDPTSWFQPTLSRARMLPNTGIPWGGTAANQTANAAQDIADGITDLQVALAFDTVAGGALATNSVPANQPAIVESTDGADDDWLFNAAADDPTSAAWDRPLNPGELNPFAWRRARLYYVRLAMVGRGPFIEHEKWIGTPPLGGLEDRTYDGLSQTDPDSSDERLYRRRVLRTAIDVRNL